MLGFAPGDIQFPEAFPIIIGERMKGRVSGNDCSTVRPVALTFDQFIANGIGQRVKAEPREGVSPSFFLAQHVIMRLVLPFATVAQRRLQLRAEKFHGVQLLRRAPHPHPDEVQVVGHEAISGAEEMFAGGGV